ncbi:MAG: glycosyltransferase, partial [Microthrixaceae bacterium]
MTSAPTLVHVATTDMSLELLLGPQLSAFVDAGYHVIGASAPGPYVSSLEARGVEHVALRHATRSMALASDLGALRELVSLFRARRPAIVHTHNPKPGFYGRIAGRIAGVPVVVNTVHGLYALPEDPWVRRTVVYALERGAATCSLVELVQNVEDLDTLRRLHVPDHKLVHLGNGIDLDRFDPMRFDAADATRARSELGAVAPEDVTVSSVGRLVAEKGHREVIAAAKLLPSNARVSVIGFDEPEKSGALTTDDRAAALASGVRMMGARHDIDWLYTGMDVFVLASHREGVPRA